MRLILICSDRHDASTNSRCFILLISDKLIINACLGCMECGLYKTINNIFTITTVKLKSYYGYHGKQFIYF